MRQVSLVIGLIVVVFLLFGFLLVSCSSSTPVAGSENIETSANIAPSADTSDGCSSANTVKGIVINEQGDPMENATVRLQTTTLSTKTNDQGQFVLCGIQKEGTFRITAYSQGYFNKEADTTAGASDITITLVEHAKIDNTDYQFLTAGLISGGDGENTGCAKCHSANSEESSLGISLPYDQWLLDAHAQSAINPRFLSMYNGTDLSGNQSPLTTYVNQKDYGLIPVRPIIDKEYYGPGFKLDFPGSTGNCATCHQPAASLNSPYETDPNLITGVGLEGVTCDFCHKVTNVLLDGSTGLPAANMPGVLSMEFLRPSGEHQLFLGPYDDVAPGEDTYSALQNTSQYCAACHSASFWGVQIYNSYGEWSESQYSNQASEQYKTCQSCHMPTLDFDHFARIENGGLLRDPGTIYSHRMLGATDVSLLENTAELNVTTTRDGNLVTVVVSVYNANAGHDMPTDSPLRQILLSVKATDLNSNVIPLISGPTLPDWTGDYAETPGIYFAKILEELWTDVSPTASYWMQTRLIEDTRLPALETRTTEFVFEVPENSVITIDTSLIYRRAFYDIMQQKGWNSPDILMEQQIIEIK